jgi:response regulator of citrate/malate metabolism
MGQREILTLLRKEETWLTANQIRDKTKRSDSSTRVVLKKLREKNNVKFKLIYLRPNRPSYSYRFNRWY